MSHFLIFIPKDKLPQKEDGTPRDDVCPLTHVGLGSIIDGAERFTEANGPTETGGIMYAWRKPGEHDFQYRENEQTWNPAAKQGELETGRYWVGIWDKRPPTAQDLLRKFPLRGLPKPLGKRTPLGNGETWHLPNLYELPQKLILNSHTGLYDARLISEYHHLELELDEWSKFFSVEQPYTREAETKMCDFLTRMLGINYHLTREVASQVLELWITSEIQQHMIDVLGMRPVLDKLAAAGGD